MEFSYLIVFYVKKKYQNKKILTNNVRLIKKCDHIAFRIYNIFYNDCINK